MATASLTDGTAVQLTFPWALQKAEDQATIVAERHAGSAPANGRRAQATGRLRSPLVARVTVERHSTVTPVAKLQPSIPVEPVAAVAAAVPAAVIAAAAVAPATEYATSVQEALSGDRIGKPVRIGAVMFRLLKRYGITDEEIAEGVASYHAKRSASVSA